MGPFVVCKTDEGLLILDNESTLPVWSSLDVVKEFLVGIMPQLYAGMDSDVPRPTFRNLFVFLCSCLMDFIRRKTIHSTSMTNIKPI
jgi:hypothetical protein